MKRIRALAVLNAVALLVQLIVSFMAQARLLAQYNVGEVSVKYPSLFTPAGITFAIWGLIYVSLAAFCAYHIVMAWSKPAHHPANKDTDRIGGWFILNNLAMSFWLIIWTNELISLSVIFIFIQLLCLIAINLRLGIYDARRSSASKLFTQAPISIYFGWITIAAMANTSSYLNSSSWDGWGLDPVDWTNMLIGVAVFITILVMTTRRNVAFGLAVAWGLYGIILKRMGTDGGVYFTVERTAWIGISLLGLIAILRIVKNRVSLKHEESFPVAQHPLK
jgi:hypothetical protein